MRCFTEVTRIITYSNRNLKDKGDRELAEMMGRIFGHPKTSAAGLLLALTTVLGVFQQQGISMGHAGTGTGISLGCALATAVLGMLAKD
jgi:hypothetical protein